ncbi:MAG: 5'-3' exonuclease [Acidimicrobiia bacterium]
MDVHLVDGTYELFRHFYALPSHRNDSGEEVAAVRGVIRSILRMLEDGVTHIGVATDCTVDSFRNTMYDGYKSGEGMDPDLWAQFPLLDAALAALGITVWPMVHYEADDALASAATVAQHDPTVKRIWICSPDKDLAQCVKGTRVVQFDRRNNAVWDAEGVRTKFGVTPSSIPDFLGLTGDSADGFPGLPGWGAKSAATLLARYGHYESIPANVDAWEVTVRSAAKLAVTLQTQWDQALLFRDLATLRRDADVGSVADWGYRGPAVDCDDWIIRIDALDCRDRLAALPSAR